MSEMKHTPGPWSASEHGDYSDYDGRCIVILGDDDTIKVCAVIGDDDEETNATARLIESAPELLDGLKSLYKAYVNTLESARDRIISLGGSCDPVDQMELGDHALLRARQLIAKAQGHSI